MNTTQWVICIGLWAVGIITEYLLLTVYDAKFPSDPKNKFGRNSIIFLLLTYFLVVLPMGGGFFMIVISKYPISFKIGIVMMYIFIYGISVFAGGLQRKKRTGRFFW